MHAGALSLFGAHTGENKGARSERDKHLHQLSTHGADAFLLVS